MTNKHLTKYFGEIDLDNVEECYETEIEVRERPVEITMNITGSKTIDSDSIQAVEDYLDNLTINEEDIRQIINQDFKEKGEAKNYIDFQLDGLDKDDIADLIEGADKKLNKKEKLLSVLYLLRVGFYPEKEDNSFAVYDYTIEEEYTNDLLVIIIGKDNNVRLTIES